MAVLLPRWDSPSRDGALSGNVSDISSRAASGRQRSTVRLTRRDTTQLTASSSAYQPSLRRSPCGRGTMREMATIATSAMARGTRTVAARTVQANLLRETHSRPGWGLRLDKDRLQMSSARAGSMTVVRRGAQAYD